MSELVRFLSGDNDVAQKTQMDPQNPTAKFVPLEPGQVLFGLEVVEDGSLLGTIYYDYKDKNGIITRVSMGNGGAGGSGGGGIIKTLATTDGTHDSEEVTAAANVIIPLPKKIFANLLSAKTQFAFPKVHDPSNTAYVNEDAAPGQSYLYGNGLHMVNPFNTLQDSWIRTIGKSGSAEATLELAMRDNASNEYIYDQIVARHYKADGTIVTDTNGRKREVVILGKNGESLFPGPVTSNGGFIGDVTGNASSATKAKNDWYDQAIDSTYLSKIVKTKNDGSVFEITSYDGRYTPIGSTEAKKDIITILGATTSVAGLITTGDQTITGNKTINSSGSLTIMKEGGFIYSGILEDKASNTSLPIWFATGGTNGTPKYSTELTYNPSTGTVTAKKFAGPATSATYDAEGGAIHDKYLKRAGGTMTGALNFADNTYNAFGDDVEIGSKDAKGKLSIHGKNDATGIVFIPYSGTVSQTISIDGAGVMTITGTLKATLDGNASTATALQTARNFHITDSSATYNGPNASFNGTADITLHMPNTFAGTLKGNADTATNADKIDGYHMGEEKWIYTNDFSQPTANTTWYLKISTAQWNSTSETIYIRCTGDNKSATVILKTGSRQPNWWGYATSYNTTGIKGVKKVISNSDDVYIKISESITKVTIKTTFGPTIASTTDTENYVDVPDNGGFFANAITVSTLNGYLNGTAKNADTVDNYHASSLWRSDGAVWNPGANVSMTGAANGQEWSFDIHKGGMTGLYWQVYEDSKSTLLKVDADTGKVSAPYGFVGALTGNASSATKLLTNGEHVEVASNNDTSIWVSKNGMLYTSGMYMTETYNDANTPVNFGNIINLAGRGAGQLLLEWTSSGTPTTGHIYYRDQRDCKGSGDWHSWQKVAFVTDNVASATKWATARNFQVDLALDNPATVAVDGTKDVILPVTGILATKHGGTGQSSHTANRLVWSETATKLSATNNHYASATQIAVNSTAAPAGYTFLVNGKTHLNGDARITGNLLMTTGGSSIFWDNGTVQQRIITTDDSTADTAVFTFQQSENTASSWNNLLTIRDNGRIVLQNEKGGIYKLVTTANTSPLIQLVSDNQDVSIFKVASGTSIIDSWNCGFDLIYKGTGSGVDNLLTLYAGDYANTKTQVIGWSVNQAGQMGIKTTPNTSYSLNINGNTYSNGKFYINNTSDASLTADGAVVIGPTDGENLTIDTNEIMARSNKAASTLYLNNDGGLVQIGFGGLLVNGQMKTTGPLLIGSDANGRTKNYIAFYGITGDGPNGWNHTFIGENLFGDTDKSELILFKGNDPGSAPEDMRYASGPGPDRIRHIAAGHLFQIYRSALSGTFATIAQSTVPISIFEVNQQGVVVYNEGTDANNYPAKITFRVKDTVNGTTSTATIAAYSDHGTTSYGSNLVISSNGNTLIQAGDGTYGGYTQLIGAGVNQKEHLYLTADGSVYLCASADTINRQLIWNGTTFYPVLNNTFNLGGSANRWASAHVYRDFNIYGNESTGDENHVRFNASDNSQRAIIAFNGNTTNTLDATTHLKIATNYGDIRLDAASNYINVKGHILPRADFTTTNYNIGSTARRWGNVYANALRLQGPSSDPSEAQGARIEFAYDNGTNRSQPVYISYTPNDGYRVPYGLKIFGTDAANYGAWLEVQGAIGTSNTNASSGIGISLYGGPVNGKPAYGMFFGGTATFGKLYNTTSSTYGVSSDWATYFTMSDTTNRGWLFMRGATNVAGITGNGTFLSRISTATHIAGNQGNVIIDGTAGAGYNMLFRQKSTNGVFTGGAWNAAWHIFYTADTTISAGTNGTTYGIRLINEAGNTQLNRLGINGENTSYRLYVNGTSYFNGDTTATKFIGPLQGNADTATRLKSLGRNNNLLIPSADAGTSGASGLVPLTGLAVYEYYAALATGAPTNYGNLLTIRGATSPGATQIALPWAGSTNTAPFIRTHSDWSSEHTWSEWKQICYTDGTSAHGTWGISITGNAHTVDGYHENSFLRYRDTVSGSGGTSHSNTLWNQIGIRQYNNVLPDAMADNATYTYGAAISLPGANSRFELWYNHNTSTNGNGLRYRTGWNDDKKAWATILDSVNYTSIADGRYVNVTGDTMTGLLTVTTSSSHTGIKVGDTYITSIGGRVIFQNNSAIRFGTDAWEYNQWAGLKYNYSNKTVYLGIADGTIFTANSPQTGGTLALPGVRYLSINGKIAIDANDTWLRINESKAFSAGIYCGSNIVRTDGQFQVGSSGGQFYANSSGNGYFSNTLGIAGTNTAYKLYVNGNAYVTGQIIRNGKSSSWIAGRDNAVIRMNTINGYSPMISAKTVSGSWEIGTFNNASYQEMLIFSYASDANYNAGTNSTNTTLRMKNNGTLMGAAWNDYAEFRKTDSIEPGRVVIEGQFGIMKQSTERLQPGANIVSDTYGFTLGDTEECQTPIAVAGRVLAYPYEDKESYPLGAAVCSGPNGTVSLMTREEIIMYPERIVGTVSEIPTYEVWGPNKDIKVNGRIWIKVR